MDWGRMDLGWIATTPGEEEENNSVGEGWIERARGNSDERAWENSDERARDISSTVAEEYFGATAPSRPREPPGSALRRVGKTASYNAARVVFSASEHGPAPSPREATLAPSPGFDKGIFVKTATKEWGQETRCTCP